MTVNYLNSVRRTIFSLGWTDVGQMWTGGKPDEPVRMFEVVDVDGRLQAELHRCRSEVLHRKWVLQPASMSMRGLQSKPSIAMSVTGENKYQNLGEKKKKKLHEALGSRAGLNEDGHRAPAVSSGRVVRPHRRSQPCRCVG